MILLHSTKRVALKVIFIFSSNLILIAESCTKLNFMAFLLTPHDKLPAQTT